MRDDCGSHLPFSHDMSSGPGSSVCERKARVPKRGRCATTAFGSDNNLSHVWKASRRQATCESCEDVFEKSSPTFDRTASKIRCASPKKHY